jgi:anti-anti-sigma regulatory factor
MQLCLDQAEAACSLLVNGSANIEIAEELKDLLIQAVATEKDLRVDMRGLTSLDVTIVQLLWAAQQKFTSLGRTCTIAGVPEPVLSVMCEAGLGSLFAGQQ